MKNILKTTIAICLLSSYTLVNAQNAAVVNGKPISSAKLNRLIEQSGQPNSPELREKARDILITKELVLQEADKRGITKNPDVQEAIEQAKLSVLVSAVFEDFVAKEGISDAELQPVYESMKSQMGGKEYKVRHILVSEEKLAKSLLAKIKAGGSFADLAKANSKDPGSAVKGGDLDWVSANSLVPEFSKVMTTLTAGQLAPEPVKTEFGWHIIQVDEIKETPIPTLAEVKPKLVQMLTQDQNWQKAKFAEMMEKFKSKAKIQ
jgi:peptidyl-prolyl cis-trans isomerase C